MQDINSVQTWRSIERALVERSIVSSWLIIWKYSKELGMNNQIVNQIDLLVEQSWKNSRNSYYKLQGFEEQNEDDELEPTSTSPHTHVEDSIDDLKIPVQLSEGLRKLIETQDNRDELEEDIKRELMRWFWMGFYQGRS